MSCRFKTAKQPIVLAVSLAVAFVTTASADIFVSGEHDSILRFDDAGVFIGQFNIGGAISSGRGVVFGPDGNMYVCSLSSNDVQRFDGTTGAFIDSFATVADPWHVVFRDNGNLLVSTFGGDVQEFDSSGAPLGVFASGAGAAGLTFGLDGNLYVGSFFPGSVRRYNGATGAFIDVFVTTGSGGLDGADGVHFGPDNNLYVSSRNTHQVLRFNGGTGAFIDVFTSGQMPSSPVDLKFGPDGNLAVASPAGDEGVKRYDGTTGVFIDTYASGNGISASGHFAFGDSVCPWDIDDSGSVGASDLLALLVSWGPCKGCPADFDDNGNVGASDLLALLANWGPCP